MSTCSRLCTFNLLRMYMAARVSVHQSSAATAATAAAAVLAASSCRVQIVDWDAEERRLDRRREEKMQGFPCYQLIITTYISYMTQLHRMASLNQSRLAGWLARHALPAFTVLTAHCHPVLPRYGTINVCNSSATKTLLWTSCSFITVPHTVECFHPASVAMPTHP